MVFLLGDSGGAFKSLTGVFLLKKADHPGIFSQLGRNPRVFSNSYYLLVKGGRREFDTPNFWTEG